MGTTQDEILALEKKYWHAIQNNDAEAAMSLTDETCLVTGAQGVAKLPRQAFEKMVKDASYSLRKFTIDDAQVSMLGEDVAVVAYRVREDLVVDGKPVHLEAADASTWVRRGGQWLCALHTEALLGDPFGRDRQAMQP